MADVFGTKKLSLVNLNKSCCTSEPPGYTRRTKVGFSAVQVRSHVYPMRRPKYLPLYLDWLKLTKLRLFGADHLCPKEAEFRKFEPILAQKEISRPPNCIKIVEKPASFLRAYTTTSQLADAPNSDRNCAEIQSTTCIKNTTETLKRSSG